MPTVKFLPPSTDEIYLQSPMGVDPGRLTRPPTLGETFNAAFGRENLVVNMARKLSQERNPPELGYNPFADERIKGTKFESQYGENFTYSYSRKDTERIIADIEREESQSSTLAAGGAAGFGASVVAGLLDPTILLPGGAIYRGTKGAYSTVRSAASVSTAAGGQIALQEAGLQMAQQTRTGTESIINIGTGALLAAFLGAGAAKLLSSGERSVLQKALKESRETITPVGPQSVGAAAADLRTGQLRSFVPPVVSRAYEAGKAAVAKVPVVGPALEKIAAFPEALALRSNPLLRMQTSQSLAARRAVGDLASSPLETIDNQAGITSSKYGIPLDLDVKLSTYEAQVELYDASNKLFSEYRFGGPTKLAAARSYLERKFGKSDDLTFDEFMTEVDVALRNKDIHPIPQVQALAKSFRKWMDIVKGLAKEQGIDLGDDVLGADSFAPRVYDRVAMTEKRPEFIQKYTEWRLGDQQKKSVLKEEVRREWDILMNARANARKVEGRIATAERRIANVEARLSERGMEAKATVARSMNASDRQREAGAAIDELKSFISDLKAVGDTDEIRAQVKELEEGIKQLEANAVPLTEKDLDAVDAAERKGILTGPMRRVARILTGKSKKMPKPPSFAKWIASMGGVKDSGGDLLALAGDKFPGLFKKDGFQWDDLQVKLMEESPELGARWRAMIGDGLDEDFSDEIRDMLSKSINGEEPEWFLKENWNEDDRFVFEWTRLLDQAAGVAGVEFKTMDDVAAFMRGEPEYGITELDFERINADLEVSGAGVDAFIEADGLAQRVAIREQTVELFKQTLDKARKNLVGAKGKEKTAKAVSREAGTNANRNLGRLGILNERAAKAQSVKDLLAQAQETAKLTEARQLEKIEDLLSRWEGKSAAEAKAAITRRNEYDAGRTPEQKAAKPRLTGADRQIAGAVRRILKGEEKTIQEIQAEAEQTVLQILSTPDGRLPKDEPGAVRGPMKSDELGDLRGSLNARKLPMPDNDLLPFLVRNPIDYTMRYLKQSLSDLGMIARFGDTEGTQALKEIADDYAKMIREAPDAKTRSKLQKAMDKDIRDFAAMRDRIKGTYGFATDAFMQSAGRVAETVKDFNVGTLGGGFGLAQFPDFAGIVFRYGLETAFKDGWMPFLGKLTKTGGEGMKAAAKDYRAFGIGAETYAQTRMMDAMDVNDIYHHKTPFERTLRMTGTGVATLSGITIATDAQKVISSTVIGNKVIEGARQIVNGTASDKVVTTLAAAGIDAPMAARIAQNFDGAGGNIVDGTYLPNLDAWTDKTAARRFQAAVLRDVEIAVITPGQEKPLFLSGPIISLLGQFKTFISAANTRILLANLQRRDATALSGLITQISLGMLSYSAYTVARGGEFHERPQDWIKEGFDRSGVLGWFGEFNAMAAKATGGKADIFRAIGADRPLSRYASRGLIDNFLGPGVGKFNDLAGITYATSNGQWTESDTTRLRRMVPFQNLFYLRRLFDEVEQNGNAIFGIEAKAQ